MTLAVDVAHRVGSFTLAARFASGRGLTAFFGRSGSGKTTLVNTIGGLIRPERGHVRLGNTTLVDTQAGVFVPSHKRRIGYVFQEARLFPHLTVRQNLLFGRWFSPERARGEDLGAVVDLLGISQLLARRPQGLSGGEKQRVAIGRALLSAPRLLLMDEPLASLDEERKAEVLPFIERLRDEIGIPIVYVSHSITEVVRLATTVVALDAGRVVAVGPPDEVLTRGDFMAGDAAGEVGALLDATVLAHHEGDGLTTLASQAGSLQAPRLRLAPGTPVRVRIRARDVLVAVRAPEGLSALNVLPGVVRKLDDVPGPAVEVSIGCGGAVILARLTRRSVRTLDLAPGRAVFAIVKSVLLDGGTLGRAPPRTGGVATGADRSDA